MPEDGLFVRPGSDELDQSEIDALPARERAYRLLRHRIVTLDLPPGSVIDVARMSRDGEVGATPIREAIQRLANEDLLTIHPRRGTVVSEPSFSQARHVMEVRDILEGRAAYLAAQRATRDDLLALRALLDLQRVERTEHDFAHFLLHDYRFHVRVAAASGNPMLVRAQDHLMALTIRLWFVLLRVQGPMPMVRYMYSHEPIFQAIEARDPHAAEAAAVTHVRESNAALSSMFESVQMPGSIDGRSGPDGRGLATAGEKLGVQR